MEILKDAAFLKKLESLSLLVRGRYHGHLTGKRVTARSGMSLEFADYKEYYPGDDLRYVDWNLYGRLNKLFIKSFTREEDVPVYIFLDVSHSMEIGDKLNYAVQLAASLAYIGLKEYNRVGIFPFASEYSIGVPPKSGHKQIFKVFQFLRDVEPRGETSINESLRGFVRTKRENGLAIIISDMLSEDGYNEGLAQLLYHGFEVSILNVLAPEDLNPELNGELRLHNIENDDDLVIHIDRATLESYLDALEEYRANLERFCRQKNMRYALISTDQPLERAVFQTLREGALVQ